jgi:RimJ/RimL family protein N-acetyltransferase
MAQPSDAAELSELLSDIHAEGHWFIAEADEFDEDETHMRSSLIRMRNAPNSAIFVARVEDGIAGAVFLRGGTYRRMRHVARLEIYVRAGKRHQGFGGSLLATAVAWAEHCPALEKLSLAVFATNEPAIRMYRRFGFEIEGHRKREYYLGEGRYLDDLLMFRFV